MVVAEELLQEDKNIDILFITSRKKQDSELISKKGFKSKKIFAGKFRRYFSILNFTGIFSTIFGFVQSFFIILKFNPSVIFAKGGYISPPVVYAGKVLRKKILIHESDFVLGLANKISLPLASKLAVSFPLEFYKDIDPKKLIFSGNPTRKFTIERTPDANIKTLLVMGGSQGARKINYATCDLLDELLNNMKIIHLVGELDFEKLEEKKKALNPAKAKNYQLFKNVWDEKKINKLLNKADLVVSRAGAGAISELAILNKPTILIPLSGHQEKNSEILEKNEAVIVIKNENLTSKALKEKIISLFKDEESLKKLKENISKFSSPEASSIIVKELIRMGS